MPVWPDTLPHQPVNWRVKPARGNLESEMASGLVRSRRQYTLNIAVVELTIAMTLTEYAAFLAFWRDTLGEGAAEFTMPVWNGYSGCPVKTVRIRNGGVYEANRVGGRMFVGFALDVYDFTAG